LHDVSFQLRRGEAIGSIGQMDRESDHAEVAQPSFLKPDTGAFKFTAYGALIELGAGFHPDLTGRENHTFKRNDPRD